MAKKIYYKIGEVCKILDIQPYVLRYWETEFPFLEPSKSKAGQRTYKQREIDIARRLKELLYDEGYTIAGAKKKLEGELRDGGPNPEAASAAQDAEKPKAKASPKGGAKKSPDEVDTGGGKQVKTLLSGLEGALAQAREILELMEPQR